MTALDIVIRPVAGVPPIALTFFGAFSRMEYALKRSGFCHRNRAEANWDAFALSLGEDFFLRALTSGEIETIINHPPQKQILIMACWTGNV